MSDLPLLTRIGTKTRVRERLQKCQRHDARDKRRKGGDRSKEGDRCNYTYARNEKRESSLAGEERNAPYGQPYLGGTRGTWPSGERRENFQNLASTSHSRRSGEGALLLRRCDRKTWSSSPSSDKPLRNKTLD